MWAPPERNWLPRIWKRLKYSLTFLSQSSLASAPATLPKLDGKSRDWENKALPNVGKGQV